MQELKNQVKLLYNYNPEDGLFRWKVNRKNGSKINDIAGGKNSRGYVMLRVNHKFYYAHRLAWLLIYDELPENGIDHINGIKDDNRILNLRKANQTENMQNLNDRELKRGTCWSKRYKKWSAQIRVSGKTHFLGYFDTQIEAHHEYLKAKENLHIFQNKPRKEL